MADEKISIISTKTTLVNADKFVLFDSVSSATRAITYANMVVELNADLPDIAANTTHRTSDGSDHTFINQNVTTTGTPTFADGTFTNSLFINNNKYLKFQALSGGLNVNGYIINDASNNFDMFTSSYATPIRIDGSSIQLNAKSSGNVGIGTTTPTAKLDVSGDVHFGITRQGGSTTDWNTGGTTNYTETGAFIQTGSATITITSGAEQGDTPIITLPTAYTSKPLVFITVDNSSAFGTFNETPNCVLTAGYPTATQIRVKAITRAGTVSANRTFKIHWMTIGK